MIGEQRRGGLFVVLDEFQFVGLLCGFVGFLPLDCGGEFGRRCGLSFLQESVGAKDDPVGVPEPNEAKAADGFELKEAIAEGVDLLFVVRDAMLAGMVEEFGEFGEFVGLEIGAGVEEVFCWAIGTVRQDVDLARGTGLIEDGFRRDYLT